VHRLSADNRYRPIIGQFADNRYRPFDNQNRPMPIIDRLFVLVSNKTKNYYEFMTHKLKLIHTPFEWMGKYFSVVRRQDSGTVQARPNRILEFPRGRNLFILHRPLNTGMGWAGP